MQLNIPIKRNEKADKTHQSSKQYLSKFQAFSFPHEKIHLIAIKLSIKISIQLLTDHTFRYTGVMLENCDNLVRNMLIETTVYRRFKLKILRRY